MSNVNFSADQMCPLIRKFTVMKFILPFLLCRFDNWWASYLYVFQTWLILGFPMVMDFYTFKLLYSQVIIKFSFLIDLTTGEPVTFMCLPCSITASCVSSTNHTTASLTFSKVVLTAEETRVYQIPWEKQQKKIHKNKHRSLCFCWCCVCTCLW